MAEPNFRNRTLYHGDNLESLRGMNSETVDLIATDPSFNKSRDFHATPDSLAAGAKFEDRWSWADDVEGEWVDQIQDDWPAVWQVIDAPRSDGGLNHITNRVLLCGPCNRLKSNQYTLSGLRRQNQKLGYMVRS